MLSDSWWAVLPDESNLVYVSVKGISILSEPLFAVAELEGSGYLCTLVKHSRVRTAKTSKRLSTRWSPGIQHKFLNKYILQCLTAKGCQSYQQSITCSLIAAEESKHALSICRASPPGFKWANGLRLFKQRAGRGQRLAGSRHGAICRGNQMWGARLSDQLIEFVLSGGSQIDHQDSRRRVKQDFFFHVFAYAHTLMAQGKRLWMFTERQTRRVMSKYVNIWFMKNTVFLWLRMRIFNVQIPSVTLKKM